MDRGRNVKILIAADSFKGSMTSAEAGEAIARGLGRGLRESGLEAEIHVVAMADGGEGTVEAFRHAAGGERVTVRCRGPLGRPVDATFLTLPEGETAVIEMAASSGLTLVKGREDVMRSDTFGLGEQILAALDRGAQRILIGIGGSATHDCGAGTARALGVRFLDEERQELGSTPSELAALAGIDTSSTDPRVAEACPPRRASFEVICDVDNPLLGPNGAAAVYSPQKGADPETVENLEAFSRRFADVVESALGVDLRGKPGVGAAGGLGFGLAAFLEAELRPGIDVMIEIAGLREHARGADLLVTGEGRMDSQSLMGKAPSGIAGIARELGVPCVAFCGFVEGPHDALVPEPFTAVYEIVSIADSLEDAVRRGPELLRELARRHAGEFKR